MRFWFLRQEVHQSTAFFDTGKNLNLNKWTPTHNKHTSCNIKHIYALNSDHVSFAKNKMTFILHLVFLLKTNLLYPKHYYISFLQTSGRSIPICSGGKSCLAEIEVEHVKK